MNCPHVGRRCWATMRGMVAYTKAAVERAMQVQEVILRAMAKRITWWQAAEIIGISDRSMRRWRERYEQHGYDGLLDRRRGAPSGRRVPLAQVEQVLGLYRERYFDLNVRHFHEKLAAEHGIGLSYTWVKQALQGAGLVAKGRKRGVHRKRRPRRAPFVLVGTCREHFCSNLPAAQNAPSGLLTLLNNHPRLTVGLERRLMLLYDM